MALGTPLAELRATLSIPHYLLYLDYRKRHGSLDPALRFEKAASTLGWLLSLRNGSKLTQADVDGLFLKGERTAKTATSAGPIDPAIMAAMAGSDGKK